jgi:hypothetical protein
VSHKRAEWNNKAAGFVSYGTSANGARPDFRGQSEPCGARIYDFVFDLQVARTMRSCGEVIHANEPIEDWSAANPAIGEVDHLRGSGFGLSRGELPERAVWSRSVEMMKMDRQDPAQVAFVDDQDLVKQLPTQRSNHPFADRVRPWCPGGLRRIRMSSAAKTHQRL